MLRFYGVFVLTIKKFVRTNLKRLLLGLSGYLFPEIKKGYELPWVIFGALVEAKNPVKVINFYARELTLPSQDIWKALKILKNNHSSEYSVVLSKFRFVESVDLNLLIFARKITEDHGPVSPKELEDLLCGFENAVKDLENENLVKSVIASAIIEKSSIEILDNYFSRIGVSISKLTDHQKVKLMGRYHERQNLQDFLEVRYRLGTIGSAALLKIDQMQFSLVQDGSDHLKELEQKFCNLPYEVSKKYKNDLKPIFDKIPESNDFTSARFDSDSVKEMERLIIAKVESGQSLSFVRVGDGECYGMADQVHVDEDGETRQEMHWWGEKLEVPLRRELQQKFQESIASGTVLGIPTVLRLIKDFNIANRQDYKINSLISRIFCVIRGVAPYLEGKIIVEDQSNLYLFRQPFIEDLFRSANKVCIVSGLDSNLIRQWAPDADKLEFIEIPTHRLLRNGDVGSSIEGILPHVYKEYLSAISSHAGPGVVFLVSAGFIGKIFIAEAASKGAVALDVGQSLVSAIRNHGAEA